jgi:hypothetical protein
MSDVPPPVPPQVPPSYIPGQTLRGPGSPRDTVGKGVLLIFLWNLGQLAAGALTLPIGVGAIILAIFGVIELAYVIPLAVIARNAGERERMKGIIIMGSVGFLLTGACWGVVLVSLSHARF